MLLKSQQNDVKGRFDMLSMIYVFSEAMNTPMNINNEY